MRMYPYVFHAGDKEYVYLASLAAQFLSVDELDVFSVYEVWRRHVSLPCIHVYMMYTTLTPFELLIHMLISVSCVYIVYACRYLYSTLASQTRE